MYLRWAKRRLDAPGWVRNNPDLKYLASNLVRGNPTLRGYLKAARERRYNHLSFETAVALEQQYDIPVTWKPNTSVDTLTPLTPAEIITPQRWTGKGLKNTNSILNAENKALGSSFEEWSYHGAYSEYTLPGPATDEFDPTKTHSGKPLEVKGVNIITTDTDDLGNGKFAFHDWNRYKLVVRELQAAATDGSVFVTEGSVGGSAETQIRVVSSTLQDALFYKLLLLPSSPVAPTQSIPAATVWALPTYNGAQDKLRYTLGGPSAKELQLGKRFTFTADKQFFHSTSAPESFGQFQKFIADSVHLNEWAKGRVVVINGDATVDSNGNVQLYVHNGEDSEYLSGLRGQSNLYGAHQLILEPNGISRLYNGALTKGDFDALNKDAKAFDLIFHGDKSAYRVRPLNPRLGDVTSSGRGYSHGQTATDLYGRPRLFVGEKDASAAVRSNLHGLKGATVTFVGKDSKDTLSVDAAAEAFAKSLHNNKLAEKLEKAADNVQKRWDQHPSYKGSDTLAYHVVHLRKEAEFNRDIAQAAGESFKKLVQNGDVKLKAATPDAVSKRA